MTIHEYPSGEPCWTWRVPEKWTCHAAYLETLDGRRLADNPTLRAVAELTVEDTGRVLLEVHCLEWPAALGSEGQPADWPGGGAGASG